MLSILIVSGELYHLEFLSSNIRRCIGDSMCIVTTSTFSEAVKIINKKDIIFDLFIINVQLKEKSGYLLEKLLRKQDVYRHVPILFLTQSSYNMIGYESLTTFLVYKHRNYIAFPLDPLDVQAKFCLYLDSIYKRQLEMNETRQSLEFRTASGIIDLPLESLLCMEIQDKVCTIYSTLGKFLVKRTSLNQILRKINSQSVVRCHRYYAVNVKKISFIEKKTTRSWTVHFTNSNITCPVSKTYFSNMPNQGV